MNITGSKLNMAYWALVALRADYQEELDYFEESGRDADTLGHSFTVEELDALIEEIEAETGVNDDKRRPAQTTNDDLDERDGVPVPGVRKTVVIGDDAVDIIATAIVTNDADNACPICGRLVYGDPADHEHEETEDA